MNTRMGRICGWIAAAGFCVAVPVEAQFEVFVLDDEGAELRLSEVMDLAGAVSIGKETFATSTLGPNGGELLPNSLLAPGVANGPFFPQGTDAGLGVYFQSNALGDAATEWSPGGPLYASGADAGFGFIRVGADDLNESLDLIINPPEFGGLIRGISFDIVVEGGGVLEIRLFNDQNITLLSGSFTVGESGMLTLAVTAAPESTFFGINLWAASGYADAGNVEIYAIPEPASGAAIAGISVFLLLWIRRRSANR